MLCILTRLFIFVVFQSFERGSLKIFIIIKIFLKIFISKLDKVIFSACYGVDMLKIFFLPSIRRLVNLRRCLLALKDLIEMKDIDRTVFIYLKDFVFEDLKVLKVLKLRRTIAILHDSSSTII